VRIAWLAAAAGLLHAAPAAADDDEPTKWEQLFFPFPIVGAPPQLEQQVQLFESYFRGPHDSGDQISAELAYILSPHLGVVATVPFQLGIDNQTTGFTDANLLLQYLAAGSLDHDDMLSIGLTATFPTGRGDLSGGDYYVGAFAYAAKRWKHRFILEGDLTAQLPVVHGASTRQVLATGMVAVMLTPRKADYPVYAQVEVDSTTYLDGTAALPPGATSTPAQTLFIAPEIFIGPFKSPIDEGTRICVGASYNAVGDAVHEWTYTLTLALDIPNKYGY
jgi:hypothetical protein